MDKVIFTIWILWVALGWPLRFVLLPLYFPVVLLRERAKRPEYVNEGWSSKVIKRHMKHQIKSYLLIFLTLGFTI